MTTPGPPGFRITALIQRVKDAQTGLEQLIMQEQATLGQVQQALTTAQATIVQLQGIGNTAQSAIVTSAQDRAALHTQVDALTARVVTLEQTVTGLAKTTDVAALTARVAALEARRLYLATGAASKALTVGGAGSVTTFTIPLSQPMPDTGYTVSPSFDTNLLASLSVQTAGIVKTKTSVTVPLINSALLAVTTSITVFATAASYQ